MADIYRRQMATLGCLDPNHEPRVSEHIEPILRLVTALLDGGHAYVVDRGAAVRDVYFSVRSYPDYGKLSRRKIDQLIAGARVERDELKRDPLDFALWKGASAEEWGWESPWGRGRPGWHIECSAMSQHYLGDGIDIHAGGMDLIFPHHENEIAQSEAANPEAKPFARFWLHNGFVNVDKEKMSKSLNNFVSVSAVLDRNDPEAFRWFLLGAHYRGPIQFETEVLADGALAFPGVDEAERRVDYLYATVRRLRQKQGETIPVLARAAKKMLALRAEVERAVGQAEAALGDDLNTPAALAALGELAKIGNEAMDLAHRHRKDPTFPAGAALVAGAVLEGLAQVSEWLGVMQAPPEEYASRTRRQRLASQGLHEQDIDRLVAERTEARKAKDFARSDAIRDELLTHRISVRDSAEGTEWTVEPR
jgi:cysteinyl-tRNA synthetase